MAEADQLIFDNAAKALMRMSNSVAGVSSGASFSGASSSAVFSSGASSSPLAGSAHVNEEVVDPIINATDEFGSSELDDLPDLTLGDDECFNEGNKSIWGV